MISWSHCAGATGPWTSAARCEWLPTCGCGCPLQMHRGFVLLPRPLEQPVKNIRLELEARENAGLHPRAARSAASSRQRQEKPSPVRTEFQRDRDRILHSKAFRRLKHKTQVFISPEGDHYRTRLTHTLELSQIARTIARALNLNEDLTEAIALGHDLGHTPFGHIGEAVLDKLCPGGFRHYEQSLRVVDKLEDDGRGLNLTREVRDGILKHSKGQGEVIPAEPPAAAGHPRGSDRAPGRHHRLCQPRHRRRQARRHHLRQRHPRIEPETAGQQVRQAHRYHRHRRHQRDPEERAGDHRHLGAGLRRDAAACGTFFSRTSISARNG